MLDLHVCEEHEVTPRIFKHGHLHLCLPIEKLSLYNNFDYFPQKIIGFGVKPNFDVVTNKTKVMATIEKLQMSRYQINSMVDMRIVKGNPIVKTVKFLGRIPLEAGW